MELDGETVAVEANNDDLLDLESDTNIEAPKRSDFDDGDTALVAVEANNDGNNDGVVDLEKDAKISDFDNGDSSTDTLKLLLSLKDCCPESEAESKLQILDTNFEQNYLLLQNIMGAHKSSSSETENATGEAGNKMNYTELPDMNEELPALPAEENSTEDGETSISRTQSLDAEHLFCNADRPSNSNTTACPNGPLRPDPSSRWVKRIKLNTSNPFASGTKSSKLGEVSSRVKINTTGKIINCSKKSSVFVV